MIDIDLIYDACRYCPQQCVQLGISMLRWNESLRHQNTYYFGPATVYFDESTSITIRALLPFKEFDLSREKRKAQWKDETRMRNGRNWKR